VSQRQKKASAELYGARKTTETDTPTIQLGTTPSGLISGPPPSSPIYMPDALPTATLPLYPGTGQAPNMLACMTSGVIKWRKKTVEN